MKKVLIIGWGKSGEGSAKLLKTKGYEIIVYDDNDMADCHPYIKTNKEEIEKTIKQIELVVVSPSIDLNHSLVLLAKINGIKVIGEIELGYKYCKSPVVAITGTNGKTTTTMLMKDILRASGRDAKALGNIGDSFCGELADNGTDDIVVLEVSSFQLETVVSFKPKFAICLNIAPDHMERHLTMQNYISAKRKIFLNQLSSDYAVLNYDDLTTREMINDIKSSTYYFSLNQRIKGAYLFENKLIFEDMSKGIEAQVVCNVSDLWSNTSYNIQNALACIVVAKLLNIPNSIIAKAVKSFCPPRYRMEYFGQVGSKNIYNDSKATNIDSTIKACNNMKGDTALIIGGYNKGISYHSFFTMLPSNITSIIGCGDNIAEIMQFMPEYHDFSWEVALTLERATELAMQKNVDNILFSPTTSSFDRYSSYVQRGQHFDNIIKEYTNEVV